MSSLRRMQYREMAKLMRAVKAEVERRNPIGVNLYTGYIEQAALALDEISGGEMGNLLQSAGRGRRKRK